MSAGVSDVQAPLTAKRRSTSAKRWQTITNTLTRTCFRVRFTRRWARWTWRWANCGRKWSTRSANASTMTWWSSESRQTAYSRKICAWKRVCRLLRSSFRNAISTLMTLWRTRIRILVCLWNISKIRRHASVEASKLRLTWFWTLNAK